MLLKFRQWCLDKFTLLPSTHPLDPDGKQELKIPSGYHYLQAFATVSGPNANSEDRPADLLVIKWPGNAGRAENSGPHPAMAWPDKKIETWTINPFGYGGSSRSASLGNIPEMAGSVLRFAASSRKDVPILLLGNSIGCATALHQAVLYQNWMENGQAISNPLIGLHLINPPPLVQLIPGYYHRWYFGPVTKWLANATPVEADAVAQAKLVRYPCFFLQCDDDEIVPPKFQNLIFDALGGKKIKWVFTDSDHNSLPDIQPDSKYLLDLQEFFSNEFE